MKYVIVSTGLFISASIMLSAAYIASAIIRSGTVGQSVLTTQTQWLVVASTVAMLAAIALLLIDYFKKE